MTQTRPIEPTPTTDSGACACERPLPVERAERKGAAEVVCLRCGGSVPVRLR